LRTADDYRAEASEFDKLARKTRDSQLRKHYVDLAAAFRSLAKSLERAADRKT
jgi:predicted hydrolase (HD superfamily)